MNKRLKLALHSTIIGAALSAHSAFAATGPDLTTINGALPNGYYTTYGDAQVYALGGLAYIYCRQASGLTQNCGGASQTPYNIGSSPGQIQDFIVLATGVGNADTTDQTTVQAVRDNANPLIDNSYVSPNAGGQSSPYFSSSNPLGAAPAQPANLAPDFTGDRDTSWDANVAALVSTSGTKNPVFLFNNNQEDKNVNLAAWAHVWVTDNTAVDPTAAVDLGGGAKHLYLTNQIVAGINGATSLKYLDLSLQHSEGGLDCVNGGQPADPRVGGDPGENICGSWTSYNQTAAVTPFVGENNNPLDPTDLSKTDYVLAGSDYCVDPVTFAPALCSAASSPVLKNNLGQNEVAYAVLFPELNAFLAGLNYGNGGNAGNYVLHVDFRLGCENQTIPDTEGVEKQGKNPATNTHCLTEFLEKQGNDFKIVEKDTRGLNNGYEQIFLVNFDSELPPVIPEPGVLALLGLALGGMVVIRRRRVGLA